MIERLGGAPDEETLELARKLTERRRQVRLWWSADGQKPPPGLVGLALSGGGIRAATFSLGVIQGLARQAALARIDILSTVSGGTYIGCFLRSLFLPSSIRGVNPSTRPPEPEEIAAQLAFASEALSAGADEKEIRGLPGSGPVRNPIWWLREHSRYLAPNGPTDYGFGAALIARNWLAMLYIFVLAMTAIMTLVVGGEALAQYAGARLAWTWPSVSLTSGGASGSIVPVSPIFLLVLLPLAASALLAVAYWMTQAMSVTEASLTRQLWNLLRVIGITLAAAALIWVAWQRIAVPSPPLAVRWFVLGALGLLTGGPVVALLVGAMLTLRWRELFTAELRRKLTKYLAWWNGFAVILVALAFIDSVGAWLRQWFWDTGGIAPIATTILLPFFAATIKKIPDWFAKDHGPLVRRLKRFMSPIALIAGIILFGMLAGLATAIVHAAVWQGASWVSSVDPIAPLFASVVVILTLLAGSASGFINLSSLHGYYASRLTRAYLGASNVDRLSSAVQHVGISENHPADYIQPAVYGPTDLPAPVHIINATLNETLDLQSQIVARDRKGDIFTLEPEGVRSGTGRDLVPWDRLSDSDCAEQLSMGQWCAISGGFAAPGMGQLTHLSYALALTFANVRLGYWWWSPDVSSERDQLRFPLRRFHWAVGTFIYLWNEMTARYSRGYARKYLSDGGHFENSGAYALIRRGVPLIVVIDAGADSRYEFGDLENLVRKARLDLGAEIRLLSGADLEEFLGQVGCDDATIFVDSAKYGDWRTRFADPAASEFAVALRVEVAAGSPRRAEPLTMVWIKPRRLAQLPQDVAGYSGTNPHFPHETTADQFFDEAQWEAYRKLAETSVGRLLRACPRLLG